MQQYIRLSKERQIELFRQAEPYLSLNETRTVVDESKELKEIREKLDKYQMLDKLIENLEQPNLEELLQHLSQN